MRILGALDALVVDDLAHVSARNVRAVAVAFTLLADIVVGIALNRMRWACRKRGARLLAAPDFVGANGILRAIFGV